MRFSLLGDDLPPPTTLKNTPLKVIGWEGWGEKRRGGGGFFRVLDVCGRHLCVRVRVRE